MQQRTKRAFILIVLLIILPQVSFSEEGFQWVYPKRVGAYGAGPIIRKAFPAWYLSPKVFREKDENGELYFRDGELGPSGLKAGGFTLLLAPTFSWTNLKRSTKNEWSIGLLGKGETVLWEEKASSPLKWDLTRNGNSAILKRVEDVIGLKIINPEGKRIYRETWQRPKPLNWRLFPFVNGTPLFSFSPTGRWFVCSKEALDTNSSKAEQTILVFDCVTSEKWEKSVDGLLIFDARFASDNKLKLLQKSLMKDGQMQTLGMGEKHKSLVLNLETKQFENKDEENN